MKLTLARAAPLLALLASCQPAPPRIPTPLGQPTAGGPMSIEGVVLSVERPRPEDSKTFVHLVISPTDQQPVRLVLAPAWYLDKQGIRFEPRQTVHVNGQHVVESGEPSILVQSIRQGDHSYLLRDQRAEPVWLKQ